MRFLSVLSLSQPEEALCCLCCSYFNYASNLDCARWVDHPTTASISADDTLTATTATMARDIDLADLFEDDGMDEKAM